MTEPVECLREDFLLREDVVFLNHGSFGACPRRVFEAYQCWQRELEAEPVEFLSRRSAGLLRAARTSLAEHVGAAPDDLVFVTNATTAMNLVARSLPLAPGDEVLSTDQEYGAIDRLWRFACGKRGARYVRAPIALPVRSPSAVVDSVWAHVTPRTRVLSLSHITSPTGIVLPVHELVRRGRERGLLTVLDGAHAPGQLPLHLGALGADCYAGNCHKWLLAPKGAGFLHVRPEIQPLLDPLVVSWGWEAEVPSVSRFVDSHEWQGTRDLAAFLSVPEAILFQREQDWATVRQRCHELLREARAGLADITGLPALTPDLVDWYVQMASFPLPSDTPPEAQKRLFEEFRIEVPFIRWEGRPLVRVSIQAYNTRDDVQALLHALPAVLARR